MQFEVRTTRVNENMLGFPHEDAVSTQLFVDGIFTNEGKAFRDKDDWCPEVVQSGFVEGHVGNQYSSREYRYRKRLRQFAFQSALGGEGVADNKGEIGHIQLVVSVGRCVWGNGKLDSKRFEVKTRDGVNEFQASKEGRSLRVGWEGDSMLIKARASKYLVEDNRVVPEAGITIMVRERSWMRGRHLIDDDDNPCTYTMFRALLEKERLSRISRTVRPRRNAQGANSSKAEPVKVEPDKAEPAMVDSSITDPAMGDSSNAGPSKVEAVQVAAPEVIDVDADQGPQHNSDRSSRTPADIVDLT